MPTPCSYSNQSWKDQKKGLFGCQVACVMSVKETWLSFPQMSQLSQIVRPVLPHSPSRCNPMWTY